MLEYKRPTGPYREFVPRFSMR